MDEGTFGVSDDGYIFVNDTLDHEIKSLYNFKVIARQEDKPPTSAHVTIQVLDENDNGPVFQFKNPKVHLYHGSISEYARAGSQILKVSVLCLEFFSTIICITRSRKTKLLDLTEKSFPLLIPEVPITCMPYKSEGEGEMVYLAPVALSGSQ